VPASRGYQERFLSFDFIEFNFLPKIIEFYCAFVLKLCQCKFRIILAEEIIFKFVKLKFVILYSVPY